MMHRGIPINPVNDAAKIPESQVERRGSGAWTASQEVYDYLVKQGVDVSGYVSLDAIKEDDL